MELHHISIRCPLLCFSPRPALSRPFVETVPTTDDPTSDPLDRFADFDLGDDPHRDLDWTIVLPLALLPQNNYTHREDSPAPDYSPTSISPTVHLIVMIFSSHPMKRFALTASPHLLMHHQLVLVLLFGRPCVPPHSSPPATTCLLT